MRTARKHIVILFFMSLVSLPLVFSACFLINKIIIESGMAVTLKSEKLQRVSIHMDNVIWLKKGKEILVNGHPFDIEEYKIQENVLVAVGLFDEKEKELTKDLTAYQEKNEKDMKTPIFHIIFIGFFSSPGYMEQQWMVFKNITYSEYCLENYKPVFSSITVPPPRSVTSA